MIKLTIDGKTVEVAKGATILEAAEKVGGKPIKDQSLIDEVTYLVEYPVIVTGTFEDRYLSLPREVPPLRTAGTRAKRSTTSWAESRKASPSEGRTTSTWSAEIAPTRRTSPSSFPASRATRPTGTSTSCTLRRA